MVSIDFEENIVKKMQHREYAGVDYQVIDALNMEKFETGSFDYALDKGTLDALCSDSSEETSARVVQYFNEVVRVLNTKGGTYVCVSLLQDFVLDALICFFNKGFGNKHAKDNIFDFKIQKIEKVSQKKDPDGNTLLPFFITVKRT